MSEELTKRATVRRTRQFEFVADFPDLADSPAILFDEPPPLGGGRAPNAANILAAAVGNCLAASLTLCLQKAHVDVAGLTADVAARLGRNEGGRLRIEAIDVVLAPQLRDADAARVARCNALFEDFCTVTASVREAIPVEVQVFDSAGQKVK